MRTLAAAGIVMLITGILFSVGAPGRYPSNPARWGKLHFLFIAIASVAFFETTQGSRILTLTAEEQTRRASRSPAPLPFIGNAF